jgi:parvulin-like peptidyl-prolyl isomerase
MLACACSTSSRDVLATFDGGAVTRDELASWSAALSKPSRHTAGLSHQESVEQIVLLRQLCAMAAQRDLGGQADVRSRLEDARVAALEGAFKNHLARTVELSEDQLERRYIELYDRFNRPRTLRLLNIYRRFPPGIDDHGREALEREMEHLRGLAVAGADFAEMARTHSDSQTRFRGGVIGHVAAGTLQPAVDAVAMRLEPGEVSEVIATEDGLTLLKCDAAQAAVSTSFDEARPVLERSLRAQEVDRLWAEFARGVIDDLDLHVDWNLLERDEVAADVIVVRSNRGSLTRAGAELVAAAGSAGRARWGGSRERSTRAFERHFIRVAAAARAAELGLDRHGGMAERLHWTRTKLLAGEMLRVLVEERFVAITVDEMAAFWEGNRGDYRRRPQYFLTVIRIGVEADRARESWIAAQNLWDRLQEGVIGMNEAARRHSDHPSAPAGGTIGPVDRRQLAATPNLLQAVDRLQPGAVSRVVEQDSGYWIVRLDRIEPERELTFEEARSLVENDLGNQRALQLQQQIEDEILSAARVRIVAS